MSGRIGCQIIRFNEEIRRHLSSCVCCVDAEAPVVVVGPDGVEDPKYTRFIKYEFPGPGGGNDT